MMRTLASGVPKPAAARSLDADARARDDAADVRSMRLHNAPSSHAWRPGRHFRRCTVWNIEPCSRCADPGPLLPAGTPIQLSRQLRVLDLPAVHGECERNQRRMLQQTNEGLCPAKARSAPISQKKY